MRQQSPEQATRLKRRWLYIPFAIAGAVVFAYYLLWSAGAREMKAAVDDWVNEQREAGLLVSHGAVKAGGFPFFLRVHISEPDIASPDSWQWRGEKLSLDALPYDLNKLVFSPTGEQVVALEGYGTWRATANDLRASIAQDKARGWIFSLNIADAKATREEDGAEATLGSLVFDLAPDAAAPETLTLTLAANGLQAKAAAEAYNIAALQTVLSLSQTHLLHGGDAGAAWRAAGGALTITGLFIDIEGTQLSAAGVISLDESQYPTGLMNTEIANPAGFARMLGKAGALTHNEAETAAAGLSLMAFAGGGKINAPIEMKNGRAEIAGVKIADLPQVE